MVTKFTYGVTLVRQKVMGLRGGGGGGGGGGAEGVVELEVP